jgi:HAD superfamily phosphoserine phosphatase-like hydrolase
MPCRVDHYSKFFSNKTFELIYFKRESGSIASIRNKREGITLDEIGVVAADLEGTLTRGQTWKGIGRYLTTHGYRLNYRLFYFKHLPGAILARRGWVDWSIFSGRWITDLLRLFKGFSEAQFTEMVEWVLDNETWGQRREDVVAELEKLRGQGHRLVIVSGAYQPVVEAFAKRLGGASAIGTPLEVVNGKLTGRLAEAMNTGESKVHKLRDFLGGMPLIAAYGDTLPDVSMLEMSQSPVAVYPDEGLRAAAHTRGWRILES